MKDGFAKELVERERHHSRDHYHNYRHVRGPKGAWDDDEVGGRESMKRRYKLRSSDKSFNENLNPLWGWLRSCLGKKWDKCYSELCKNFDMRGVINAHILQHLYQELETNTFVGDKGQVLFHDSGYSANKSPRPIKECYKDYYVCPKDGTVKKTQKQPRRSVIKQREAEARAKELTTKRYIGDKEILHLIDGVWYHFDLLPIPRVKVVFRKPIGTDVFKIGYHFGSGPDNRREKTWDELNQTERERFGVRGVEGATAKDEFTGDVVYLDQNGRLHNSQTWKKPRRDHILQTHYHANKKTASKKQLRAAGVV